MTDVILVESNDRLTLVAAPGKPDAAGVGAVDLKLTTQTVSRRKPAIIDLRDVDFIASLGIGMLVRIAKALRAHGQGTAVVAAGQVRSVLDAMALGALFPVVATP